MLIHCYFSFLEASTLPNGSRAFRSAERDDGDPRWRTCLDHALLVLIMIVFAELPNSDLGRITNITIGVAMFCCHTDKDGSQLPSRMEVDGIGVEGMDIDQQTPASR